MSRAMRNLVVIVAVALAVIATTEGVVRAIDDRFIAPDGWSIPELPYKLELVEHRDGSSVLFVGSSVMDAGVDPSSFDDLFPAESPSFNGSLGASSLPMVAFATIELWLPRLEPELVVIGLSSRDLNANDPRQSMIERRFFDSPEVERILGRGNVVERVDRWLGDHSALWRHRAQLRSWSNVIGDPQASWGPAFTADDGQYVDFADQTYEPSEAQFEFVREGPLNEWEVSPERTAAVEQTIHAARRAGVRVVLVEMPTAADLVRLHPGGATDVARYQEVLDRLALEHGVPLLRFGPYPSELMADVLHLNDAGAQRFTGELAQQIRRLDVRTGSR